MSKSGFAIVALVGVMAGCNSKPAPTAQPTEHTATAKDPTVLSVADVATALQQKKLIAVDANGAETRQQYGVVPGAVLLTDHRNYALSELPSDKAQALVFYCGGTQCRASDAAASRAMSAGYANVSIMRDGITGWTKAGQPTSSFPKS